MNEEYIIITSLYMFVYCFFIFRPSTETSLTFVHKAEIC